MSEKRKRCIMRESNMRLWCYGCKRLLALIFNEESTEVKNMTVSKVLDNYYPCLGHQDEK